MVLVGIPSLGLTAVDFPPNLHGVGAQTLEKTGTLFTSLLFAGTVKVSVERDLSPLRHLLFMWRPLRKRDAGRQAVTDRDKLGLLEFPHSLITSRREDVAAAKKHLCDSG